MAFFSRATAADSDVVAETACVAGTWSRSTTRSNDAPSIKSPVLAPPRAQRTVMQRSITMFPSVVRNVNAKTLCGCICSGQRSDTPPSDTSRTRTARRCPASFPASATIVARTASGILASRRISCARPQRRTLECPVICSNSSSGIATLSSQRRLVPHPKISAAKRHELLRIPSRFGQLCRTGRRSGDKRRSKPESV